MLLRVGIHRPAGYKRHGYVPSRLLSADGIAFLGFAFPETFVILRRGWVMRLAVVSDTHGHFGSTSAAVRRLAAENVAVVVHCGDIGSPAIIPLFAGWPAHFVFGNVDHNEGELARAIEEAGQNCHARFGSLELAGRKIA